MGKNDEMFFDGLAIGLLGGVAANIFVTSMYRVIDKNPQGDNWSTFLGGFLILFIVIISLFYSRRIKNLFTRKTKRKSNR